MKKERKKREWIKNAAIIFLAALLVLTFFSNTIMNYSLPEVATVYVQSGSVKSTVRGSGTLQTSEPYNVVIDETRIIETVDVRKGAYVEKGDVIYTLRDGDSEELKQAQKTLDSLQQAFDMAMLSSDVTTEMYNEIKSGSTATVTEYRKQIDSMESKITGAENNVQAYKVSVKNLENQIDVLESTVVDTSKEQKALDDANAALTGASIQLAAAETSRNNAKDIYDSYGKTVAEAQAALLAAESTGIGVTEAQQTLANVTSAYNAWQNAIAVYDNAYLYKSNCSDNVNNAEGALRNKKNTATSDATLNNFKLQLTNEKIKLTEAQQKLDDLNAQKSELLAKINKEITLASQYDELNAQKKTVEELKKKAKGATITAPIAGNVTSLNYVAGDTANSGSTVAVMQAAGVGYTLSFSVTKEQAAKLSVGDVAETVNYWSWDAPINSIILSAIKPDTTNPATNRILTFDIQGENLTTGQQIQVSVGQRSANYDLIVPNSAIREDSNGKYVLIVESKNSPLGNRYMATRVAVEVIATDDTQSAITGALYGYEYVITTSTKPVEDGQQVRLAD